MCALNEVKGMKLKMKDVVKSFYVEDGKFNYDAVKKARENKEEISDLLLEELSKIINKLAVTRERVPMFTNYALFLLAEFREKRAFPLVLKLIILAGDDAYGLLTDGVIDKLDLILCSLYDGDLESLNKIILNNKLDGSSRSMALSVYQYLYENNMIKKEELINFLRKVIEVIKETERDTCSIADGILIVIESCHLFEMIIDVQKMYDEGLVLYKYSGGYDDFIDNLFDYEKSKENKIRLINNVEDEMAWWYCFNKDKENKNNKSLNDFSYPELLKKFDDYLNESTQVYDYSKVGRNDLCPCGSGKKFKKCCIDKVKDMLPYQKYISSSLADYPKNNENKDEVNFYTYYKQEYIEIDKLLYKALKRKSIPLNIKRDLNKELRIDYEYLKEAWRLIKNLISNNNFKSISEYDETVSIHYSLLVFLEKYSECLFKLAQSKDDRYIKEFEELIKFFYEKFEITKEDAHSFMNVLADYFHFTKKYNEGIKHFESLIGDSRYCQECLYMYLFSMYNNIYDEEEFNKKVDKIINEEKDKEFKKILKELKSEFEEDI